MAGAVEKFSRITTKPTLIERARLKTQPHFGAELAFDALEELYEEHGFPEFKDIAEEKEREAVKTRAFDVLAKVYGHSKAVSLLRDKMGILRAQDVFISSLRAGNKKISPDAEAVYDELRVAHNKERLSKEDSQRALKLAYEFRKHAGRKGSFSDIGAAHEHLKLLSEATTVSEEHLKRQADLAMEVGRRHMGNANTAETNANEGEKISKTLHGKKKDQAIGYAFQEYRSGITNYREARKFFQEAAGIMEKLGGQKEKEDALAFAKKASHGHDVCVKWLTDKQKEAEEREKKEKWNLGF
jgi:hypothetical protein